MTAQSPTPLAKGLAHIAVGVVATYGVRKLFRPGPSTQLVVALASMFLHEQLDAPLAARLTSMRL